MFTFSLPPPPSLLLSPPSPLPLSFSLSLSKICTWLKIKVHHVLLYIQGTLTYTYLSRSEQLVFQSYEYVDCRGNMSVPHLLVPHLP